MWWLVYIQRSVDSDWFGGESVVGIEAMVQRFGRSEKMRGNVGKCRQIWIFRGVPTFIYHVKASVLSKTAGVKDQGKSGVRQRAKTDKTGTSTKTVPKMAFFRCWCTFKKETKKKEKILQRAAMLQELERRRGGSAAVFFIVIM
jgi:hypothetical protein